MRSPPQDLQQPVSEEAQAQSVGNRLQQRSSFQPGDGRKRTSASDPAVPSWWGLGGKTSSLGDGDLSPSCCRTWSRSSWPLMSKAPSVVSSLFEDFREDEPSQLQQAQLQSILRPQAAGPSRQESSLQLEEGASASTRRPAFENNDEDDVEIIFYGSEADARGTSETETGGSRAQEHTWMPSAGFGGPVGSAGYFPEQAPLFWDPDQVVAYPEANDTQGTSPPLWSEDSLTRSATRAHRLRRILHNKSTSHGGAQDVLLAFSSPQGSPPQAGCSIVAHPAAAPGQRLQRTSPMHRRIVSEAPFSQYFPHLTEEVSPVPELAFPWMASIGLSRSREVVRDEIVTVLEVDSDEEASAEPSAPRVLAAPGRGVRPYAAYLHSTMGELRRRSPAQIQDETVVSPTGTGQAKSHSTASELVDKSTLPVSELLAQRRPSHRERTQDLSGTEDASWQQLHHKLLSRGLVATGVDCLHPQLEVHHRQTRWGSGSGSSSTCSIISATSSSLFSSSSSSMGSGLMSSTGSLYSSKYSGASPFNTSALASRSATQSHRMRARVPTLARPPKATLSSHRRTVSDMLLAKSLSTRTRAVERIVSIDEGRPTLIGASMGPQARLGAFNAVTRPLHSFKSTTDSNWYDVPESQGRSKGRRSILAGQTPVQHLSVFHWAAQQRLMWGRGKGLQQPL